MCGNAPGYFFPSRISAMWPVARAKLLELPRAHWNAMDPETAHSDATDWPLLRITLSIPCEPRRQESQSSAARLLATRGAWFHRSTVVAVN
jgi:hypothetical protein